MKQIKYVGRFASVEAEGIKFPKGKPIPIHNEDLGKALSQTPDFVEVTEAPQPEATLKGK